jgi:hypothetical protein
MNHPHDLTHRYQGPLVDMRDVQLCIFCTTELKDVDSLLHDASYNDTQVMLLRNGYNFQLQRRVWQKNGAGHARAGKKVTLIIECSAPHVLESHVHFNLRNCYART